MTNTSIPTTDEEGIKVVKAKKSAETEVTRKMPRVTAGYRGKAIQYLLSQERLNFTGKP